MEVKLKGGQVAVIDDCDYPLISMYRWRLNREGYAVSHRMVEGRPILVFMHRLINNTPVGAITDHIDRDKLNNRRRNLRTANRSMNSFNSKMHSRNRSGFRGVSWHAGRWRAAIVVNGQQENLGRFRDPREASAAYQRRLSQIEETWASEAAR